MDDPPDMPTLVHRYDQLPPKTELYGNRSPEADLINTVMQLKLEVDVCAVMAVNVGYKGSAGSV